MVRCECSQKRKPLCFSTSGLLLLFSKCPAGASVGPERHQRSTWLPLYTTKCHTHSSPSNRTALPPHSGCQGGKYSISRKWERTVRPCCHASGSAMRCVFIIIAVIILYCPSLALMKKG
ncbi:hypothetical protein AOLI_G00308250 [Acnodon oligacanthus]